MAERRCGTCALWKESPPTPNIIGKCKWFPRVLPASWDWSVDPLQHTAATDGTGCPCWRPREEKGESDDVR